MKLRPYQTEQITRVVDALGEHRAVMMQSVTGSGKTVMAAEIARRWREKRKGGAITVLTHRRELEAQTVSAFVEYGLPKALVRAISPVRARNRGIAGESGMDDLLIADEAHHAPAETWESVIAEWRGGVLGLTATPWRMSDKEGFDHIFDALDCGLQPAALTDSGYLAPIRTLAARTRIKGKGKRSDGDFAIAATMRGNDRAVLIENGVDELIARGYGGARTIAYCIGVEHAQGVAAAARARGIAAGVILGASSQSANERDANLAAFAEGRLTLLANVEVATEGFDLPEAEVCLMLRPTQSLALYLQMIGRVRRPIAGKMAVLLDATDNHERFGLPDKERSWSLFPRPAVEGEPPMKDCPNCENKDYMATHVCRPCGFPYGRKCAAAPFGCGEWRTHKHWNESVSTLRCVACIGNEELDRTRALGVFHASAGELARANGMIAELSAANAELRIAAADGERAARDLESVEKDRDMLAAKNREVSEENRRLRARSPLPPAAAPIAPPSAPASPPNGYSREIRDEIAAPSVPPPSEANAALGWRITNDGKKYWTRINGLSVTAMPSAYGGGWGYVIYGEGGERIDRRFRIGDAESAMRLGAAKAETTQNKLCQMVDTGTTVVIG